MARKPDYIWTTGEVLAELGPRCYQIRTPIGKVVRGFVESKDCDDLEIKIGTTVELQFKHTDLSTARIIPGKTAQNDKA